MDLSPSLSTFAPSAYGTNEPAEWRPTLQYAFGSLQALEQDGASGIEILAWAIRTALHGRIAVVSSFGAESALLLSIVAEIDRSVPVVFLETGKHFPDTLAYRDKLAAYLGLSDLRSVTPVAQALADHDPTGDLWYYDQDACCRLRKVGPLEQALSPFDAWISGRKRFQSATRVALPLVEREGERLKLNPLADWSAERIASEVRRRGLPPHPLTARGYPSIGCSVCTRAVNEGEDTRAGRWAGSAKVECGIHALPVPV